MKKTTQATLNAFENHEYSVNPERIPFIRTAYNYDTNRASNDAGLHCDDKSLAQQHQAQETDINFIVKRYIQTGELPQRNIPPMQGDFTAAPDMQKAMDLVVAARVAFMQQPAEIRTRFNNDPVQFVNFCSDEKNSDEMRRMGMWSPEANASFELQAQTAKDLAEANKKDAEELRASKKGDTRKGVT